MKNLKTNFGKLKVTQSQKTNLVQKLFSEINDKYDLMNDLMSFGTHRIWKKILIELILYLMLMIYLIINHLI